MVQRRSKSLWRGPAGNARDTIDRDRFARLVAASLDAHRRRGLVDHAFGLDDVAIHGRVDLTAVAEDLLAAAADHLAPPRRSWSRWFAAAASTRRTDARRNHARAELLEQIATGPTPAEAAIARLRLRDLSD